MAKVERPQIIYSHPELIFEESHEKKFALPAMSILTNQSADQIMFPPIAASAIKRILR